MVVVLFIELLASASIGSWLMASSEASMWLAESDAFILISAKDSHLASDRLAFSREHILVLPQDFHMERVIILQALAGGLQGDLLLDHYHHFL
jgi:hypothetical protein